METYPLQLTKDELDTLEDALSTAEDVYNDQAEDFGDAGSAKAREAVRGIQRKVWTLLNTVINQTQE